MAATDSFGKHEVVHAASIIVEMIDCHLCQHGAVEANPKWQELADKLVGAANEFYQLVAIESDTINKTRLKEIIKAKSFREGDFALSSGVKSNYFFDLKQTMLDGEGLNLLTDALFELLHESAVVRQHFVWYETTKHPLSIGGMAVGAIPLVTSLIAKANQHEANLGGFFVRKEAKEHGTKQKIEGLLVPGQGVILIEDVSSTGASLMAVVDAVREIGCKVKCAFTAVDRQEGAKELLMGKGIVLHSLFEKKDFM